MAIEQYLNDPQVIQHILQRYSVDILWFKKYFGCSVVSNLIQGVVILLGTFLFFRQQNIQAKQKTNSMIEPEKFTQQQQQKKTLVLTAWGDEEEREDLSVLSIKKK